MRCKTSPLARRDIRYAARPPKFHGDCHLHLLTCFLLPFPQQWVQCEKPDATSSIYAQTLEAPKMPSHPRVLEHSYQVVSHATVLASHVCQPPCKALCPRCSGCVPCAGNNTLLLHCTAPSPSMHTHPAWEGCAAKPSANTGHTTPTMHAHAPCLLHTRHYTLCRRLPRLEISHPCGTPGP